MSDFPTHSGRRLTADALGEEQARHGEGETRPEAVARYLPVSQWALADMSPADWVRIAALARSIAAYRGFAGPLGKPFRLFFGSLAADLYQEAQARDEPLPEASEEDVQRWDEWVERIVSDAAIQRAFGDFPSGVASREGRAGMGGSAKRG